MQCEEVLLELRQVQIFLMQILSQPAQGLWLAAAVVFSDPQPSLASGLPHFAESITRRTICSLVKPHYKKSTMSADFLL